MYSYYILAGINNVQLVLPSCHVYEFLIMDIVLGHCFDSQCLSECCPSSTTVDKKSTTGEKKAAGDSQELFILDLSYNIPICSQRYASKLDIL